MRRRHVALALLVALTAACGSGDAGVNVKRLDADVVFGIKEQTPEAAVQSITAPPVDAGPDEEVHLLTPQSVEKFSKPKIRTDLFAAQSCPAAALNAFPEKAAGQQVDTLPEPGIYRWKRGGTSKLVSLNNQEVPFSGYEQRFIRNVTKVSESQNATSDYDDKRNIVYRFEVIQPFGTGIRETTFQVKTNAGVQRQASAATGNRVRAGDPEAGIAIKRIVTRDRQGTEESVFEVGLLILPLPVAPGESFTSVAKGSRGDALEFRGTVKAKERVDACGTIIEGYRVTGTLGINGEPDSEWGFLVATQYGAMLIEEQFKSADEFGSYNPVYTIGQLKPTPMPTGPGA